jgi:hypothetical protein
VLESLKWYEIATYWCLDNHFCIDWRRPRAQGRLVFFTLEVNYAY